LRDRRLGDVVGPALRGPLDTVEVSVQAGLISGRVGKQTASHRLRQRHTVVVRLEEGGILGQHVATDPGLLIAIGETKLGDLSGCDAQLTSIVHGAIPFAHHQRGKAYGGDDECDKYQAEDADPAAQTRAFTWCAGHVARHRIGATSQ
jgi:hypothetical protein